jgi:hypothetical protein
MSEQVNVPATEAPSRSSSEVSRVPKLAKVKSPRTKAPLVPVETLFGGFEWGKKGSEWPKERW